MNLFTAGCLLSAGRCGYLPLGQVKAAVYPVATASVEPEVGAAPARNPMNFGLWRRGCRRRSGANPSGAR